MWPRYSLVDIFYLLNQALVSIVNNLYLLKLNIILLIVTKALFSAFLLDEIINLLAILYSCSRIYTPVFLIWDIFSMDSEHIDPYY